MTRALRTVVPALSVAAVLALATAPSASADCAADDGTALLSSPHVVLARAVDGDVTFTRFAVEEVWAGPDVAPQITVQTGQEQPRWPLSMFGGVASSGDVTPVRGMRYVVGTDAAFTTNVCLLREAGDAIALRPADARPPVAGAAAGVDDGGSGRLVVGGLALLAAGAGAVAVLRRRRPAPPP